MSSSTPSIVNTDPLEKLRPLGAVEQFSSARHHLGFYKNVGISATYSYQDLAPIAMKNTIFAALALVVERHPILSTVIVDEDSTSPYFARLPQFNLEDVVMFMTRKLSFVDGLRDIELDSILETQHNISFKSHYGSLPFWRLVILKSPSIENEFVASFIFHHAFGDGGSGMAFHRDFLSALSANLPLLTSCIVYPPKNELLPNLELILPLQVPYMPSQYTPIDLWTAESIRMPTSSHFRSLVIPKEATEHFVQACKSQGTTITAAIPVVIASALMRSIPDTFKTVECTVPVSLRRWLKPIDEDAMGVWIDAFSQYFQRENVEIFSWNEARRSKGRIVDYLRTNGRSINIARFSKIKDMREFFLSKVGTKRTSSFEVSNLGGVRIDPGESGNKWKMGRVVFSRSAFVSGSAISVGVVTGGDGCLVLGFVWQDGVVSSDLIDEVIGKVGTSLTDGISY